MPGARRRIYDRFAILVLALFIIGSLAWTADVLYLMFRPKLAPVTELSLGDMRFAVPVLAQRYVMPDDTSLSFSPKQEPDAAPLLRAWGGTIGVSAEAWHVRDNRLPVADRSAYPALDALDIPAGTDVSVITPTHDLFALRVPGALIQGRQVEIVCGTSMARSGEGHPMGHICSVDHPLTDAVVLRMGFSDRELPASSWPEMAGAVDALIAKYTISRRDTGGAGPVTSPGNVAP